MRFLNWKSGRQMALIALHCMFKLTSACRERLADLTKRHSYFGNESEAGFCPLMDWCESSWEMTGRLDCKG